MMLNTQILTTVLLVCGNFLSCWAGKSTTQPSGIQILGGLCMPRRTDRLVYRHKNDTHVYIAFDRYRQGSVTVYSWEILKAKSGTFISPMTEQTVLAVDFRPGVGRDHIIGATSKRHHKTFKTRLHRKMENCVDLVKRKQKRCKLTSIMSLFVRLKIRNISFNMSDCDKSGFWEKSESEKKARRKGGKNGRRRGKGDNEDNGNGNTDGDSDLEVKDAVDDVDDAVNSEVAEKGGTREEKRKRRRQKNRDGKQRKGNRRKDGRKRRKKQG